AAQPISHLIMNVTGAQHRFRLWLPRPVPKSIIDSLLAPPDPLPRIILHPKCLPFVGATNVSQHLFRTTEGHFGSFRLIYFKKRAWIRARSVENWNVSNRRPPMKMLNAQCRLFIVHSHW